MTRETYAKIEAHMLSKMHDSAHDRHHVYRVLYAALDIAAHETAVDYDVLLAACLLHDIGRDAQFENPALCHAAVGGEMARQFLQSIGWPKEKASHVAACVCAHRFRDNNAPETIEAQILFDADKLDSSGALGIARTLIYGGQMTEPLCILDEAGHIVLHGGGADISSFFQEYHYKLKGIYSTFYTARAREIAAERQRAAIAFHDALHEEITQNAQKGRTALQTLLQEREGSQ